MIVNLKKLKEDYPQFFESVNNNSASKKELSKLYNLLENELNNMNKKLGLSKQEYVNRIKNNESSSESSSDEDTFNKNYFNRDSSSQYPFSKSSSNSDSSKENFSSSNNKSEKDKSISGLIPEDSPKVNESESNKKN